jgi:hypothetical protein
MCRRWQVMEHRTQGRYLRHHGGVAKWARCRTRRGARRRADRLNRAFPAATFPPQPNVRFWVRRALLLVSLAAILMAVASAQAAAPKRLTPTRKAAVTASLTGTAAVADAPWNALMGAGDVSAALTDTNTRDFATSEIMRLASPGGIFADGDTQYPSGDLADFQSPDGYSGSWGRPEVKGITCAVVGNHEYRDAPPGPAGFLAYFNPNCPNHPDTEYATKVVNGVTVKIPTVYAFRCAPGSGWWCYGLDSQCAMEGTREPGEDCSRYSPQLTFLRNHMAAHVTSRRIVFYHAPRWGNGAPFGDLAPVQWLYNVAAYHGRACLIINAHNHSYERFTSMLENGTIDTSYTYPRSFTVGTGGAAQIAFSKPIRVGTRVRFNDYGVLRVTLGAGSWSSEFDSISGQVRDVTGASCGDAG